ncbi:hypothetical protein MKZ38_007396 [Zalerion maritima]|uniref:DUF4336 domain-containing protein n=1 Tax=Zalerion maritima TaxID=339359 RepID=A0AAD5RHS0_9PEZI|nr:hypothetical protein MKZ38_007396 [Zalerion maritima]
MAKLVPDNPSAVMVIRQVTPNISTLSVPFARFGRFAIGGRATLVRLQSGSLAVFSPVALTPEVKSHVTSLNSPVSYIVAPDIEHHIFLTAWHSAYPSAKIIGVEGLPEKRAKSSNPEDAKVPFSVVFTKGDHGRTKIDEEFDAEFEYEYVPGHANKELVFLAKRESTLVEADMMFNLPATEQYSRVEGGVPGGIWNKIFNTVQGLSPGRMKWQQRFLWYGASSGDRSGFNKSVARIAGWEFDKIVPCHGDVVEEGGSDVWRRLFAWHINAAAGAEGGKKKD